MRPRSTPSWLTVAGIAAAWLIAAPAFAAETWTTIGSAVPDECFQGVGAWPPDGRKPYNEYPLTGACKWPGRLKSNESYAWGLTKYGQNVFLGTGQNILCSVIDQIGSPIPIRTKDYVCELDNGPADPVTGAFNDNRPPGMYMHNGTSGLTDLLPSLPPSAEQLRLTTVGIRSAGSHEGVAFLAGPGIGGGVNMFAFDATNGAFIGATSLPAYNNVRKWLIASDGRLYLGVAAIDQSVGGVVLRWTGNRGNPFQFEQVGVGLSADAAEIAEHEGRIFVSSWPAITQGAGLADPNGAALWMSPPLAQLGPVNVNAWVRLWSASDYEPDPVTAATYVGGALASYGGWLYWGTMHAPFTGFLAHAQVYGQPTGDGHLTFAIVGTWRAFSMFRGKDFGAGRPKIELLYGGSTVKLIPPGWYNAYLCPRGAASGCADTERSWQVVPNKMRLLPRYGRAGFGNAYNNYCWTMQTWKNRLYVGTMDHSYLIYGSLTDTPPWLPLVGTRPEYGADLFRFDSSASAAVAVDLGGMGNPLNYGIRTMVADGSALYIGTANPMNLNPDGGWELIRLTDR